MLRAAPLFRHLGRLRVWCSWPVLLSALVTLGVLGEPSVVDGAQLTLTWVDNSGGQAGVEIERKTGAAGTYTEIALQPAGTPSYVDTTVISGTTYCYRLRAFNDAGTSDYTSEACASPAGMDLAVVRSGSGTVVSSPSGINCGTACSQSYAGGTVVTLTATPAAGATFSGWTSGGCSGTDPCTLAGNGPIVVGATFATTASLTSTLTVNEQGPGTVTSSPGGISCGSVCAASYASGTVVTLTAVPARGATFKGWGGACTGTGACTVTVNANVSVLASFGKDRKK